MKLRILKTTTWKNMDNLVRIYENAIPIEEIKK